MLKKTISDREALGVDIIDVSFKELIGEREALVNRLSTKLDLPSVEKKSNKISSKFFKNKYKFNRDDYGVSKENVDAKLDFYTNEYSKYL